MEDRLRLLYGTGIMATAVLSAGAALMVNRAVGVARVAGFERAVRRLFFGYLVFYVTFMVGAGVLRTKAFHTYGDLATHLEILWRATRGLGLTSSMSAEYWTGPHWFAAHFTPIAYVTTIPLFWLVPSAETLTVLQTAVLAVTVVPISLYARDQLGHSAMFFAGVAFLAYPTLQYTNLYDFEYLRLSIPCLAWAFYSLTRRWWATYWVMTALALMAREEVGLVVAALGVYAWIFRRERVVGPFTMALGSAYFVIAVLVVIPSFRESGGLVYLGSFTGQDPNSGVSLLELMGRVASTGYDQIRLANLAMLLLPFQFLSLGGLPILLVTLPNVLSTFASRSVSHYAFFLYYLSPSVPFIAYAAIDGGTKLRDWLVDREPLVGDFSVLQRKAVLVSGTLLASGSLMANVFFGPSPLSLQFWIHNYRIGDFYTTNFHLSNYLVTVHARTAAEMIDAIPSDAIISTEQFFLPHLYDRRRMYVFPFIGDDVGYVLIDRKHRVKTGWGTTYLDFRQRPEHYYRLIEGDPEQWRLLAEADGVRLFVRRER